MSPCQNGAGLPAVLTQGVALLERAMGFTLGGLLLVTPAALERGTATPCDQWDLRALLLHMNESLHTLHEAIAVGYLAVDPDALAAVDADYGDPLADPISTLRNRACQMVGAWVAPGGPTSVSVGDRSLTAEVVAAAGALEVAVHGWDVSRALGEAREIPPSLAHELLELVPVFVDGADRPHRFGPPVPVAAGAAPGDRLVALLGRDPAYPRAHPHPHPHPHPSAN